jgi:hypothetical protein
MKVTITLELENDGKCSSKDAMELFNQIIPGCWLSEDIGKPDKWALVVKSYEIDIKQI